MRSPLAAFALFVTVLLWSGNFVVGRAISGVVDPVTLNTLRWVVAAAVFLPVALPAMWRARAALWRDLPIVVALGLTGVALFNALVYRALAVTPVLNALLLLSLTPMVILFGSALVGRARIGPRQLVALALSCSGVAILLSDGQPSQLLTLRLGPADLWVMAAVLCWAVYTLLLRQIGGRLAPAVSLGGAMITGLLALLPAMAVMGRTDVASLDRNALAAIGYVGLGASLLAYQTWGFGVRRLGPEIAGFFLNLMPVLGATLAWLFLGEGLRFYQLAGGAVILAAIFIISLSPAREPPD